MKNKPWYPVVYMFFVTAFFSSIVIGFASLTKDRVQANRKLAFERAILEVFGLAEGLASGQIHQSFGENISGPDAESGGAYLYKKDGKLKGYALPISGKGFWAPIKGIIGIKTDKETIMGISFYEQNETPGLGAQIETADFRDQFHGKKISSGREALIIKPVGTRLADNEVHAISGATQTCSRLAILINEDINRWKKAVAGKEVSQ